MSTHKHFGLVFQNNFKWASHIDIFFKSCSKKLDLMRSLMYKSDQKSLETIYISFVRSQLDYGSIIYLNSHAKDLEKIDKIHYEATRIIIGGTKRASRTKIRDKINIPTPIQWRSYFTLCYIYMLYNNLGPLVLNNIFNKLGQQAHNYRLRDNTKLLLPRCRTETFRKSFFFQGIQLWNNLEHE